MERRRRVRGQISRVESLRTIGPDVCERASVRSGLREGGRGVADEEARGEIANYDGAINKD